MPDELLHKYPLISDQVSTDQVRVILTELQRTLQDGTDGAVVEFGCYIGTTSLFMRRLLNAQRDNREFHVYDSFAGLPAKSPADSSVAGDQFVTGELSVSKKDFLREFQKAGLQPPKVHKAWFGDLTPQAVPEQIAFAFLDGDFYQSIHDSLRLVLPRLSPGATIIIDDYAREALPGVRRAVQALLAPELQRRIATAHNLAILHL